MIDTYVIPLIKILFVLNATLIGVTYMVLLERKVNDVVMLGLSEVSDMTDYFIIASGTSDTHVRASAQHVIDEMKKEGNAVYHVEGLQQGRWVVLDYVDFVVHVFHPTLRSFYQLERLWSDAEVVPTA